MSSTTPCAGSSRLTAISSSSPTTRKSSRAAQAPIRGKVGVVTGGGSGHEPAFIGYVGRNMLDAVAVGEIFSSPTAKSFHDAMKIADGGRGVVCLYGNYAGDNMNVKMAVKLAAKDGARGAHGRGQRRRLLRAAERAREAPRRRRRDPDVEVRRRQGRLGREPAKRCRRRRRRRSTIAVPSASASGRARCRRSATPISPSSRERWRSASATTASRGRTSSR